MATLADEAAVFPDIHTLYDYYERSARALCTTGGAKLTLDLRLSS